MIFRSSRQSESVVEVESSSLYLTSLKLFWNVFSKESFLYARKK